MGGNFVAVLDYKIEVLKKMSAGLQRSMVKVLKNQDNALLLMAEILEIEKKLKIIFDELDDLINFLKKRQ